MEEAKQKKDYFDSTQKIFLYILILGLPLFVLTKFVDIFLLPKTLFLSTGVLVLVLLKTIESLFKGKIVFKKSKYNLPLIIIFLAFLLSPFLLQSNKIDAFFFPGSATYTMSAIVLFFVLNQRKDKKQFIFPIFLSGLLLSLSILFSQIGVFLKIPALPTFFKNPLFSPIGGLLPTAIYLAVLVPLGIHLIIEGKGALKKTFSVISLVLVLLALVLSILNILPGKQASPTLPDLNTSWNVAVNAIKESPLFGVGSGGYLVAFNRYRPVSYNLTDNWALKFTTSTNWYLTLVTEAGLVGVMGLLLLFSYILKDFLLSLKSKEFNWEKVSLVILAISLAFFPGSISLVLLFMILLALFDKSKENKIIIASNGKKASINLPSFIVSVPVLGLLILLIYLSIPVISAEAKVGNAIKALSLNNGLSAYNFMRDAIQTNPKVDRYHVSYSQINLALAQSLASQQNLTEEDRNTLTLLIQQSIAESKSAVSISPLKASMWSNLGRTYRAILSFAQGADQFAIQSYRQAVSLDPVNPNLRISLGGLYYALGDYDNAIRAFELAALAKPDLANAYYNLSVALREKGEIEKAIEQMALVLSLVEKDSNDYETAKTELEKLEARIVKGEPDESENLVPPKETQQVVKPPIELPEDSNPPENIIEQTEE